MNELSNKIKKFIAKQEEEQPEWMNGKPKVGQLFMEAPACYGCNNQNKYGGDMCCTSGSDEGYCSGYESKPPKQIKRRKM